MMHFTLIVISSWLTMAQAQDSTSTAEVTSATEAPTTANKFMSLDAQLSLEYRSDRLRELQNPETTNIRNFSLLARLFDDDQSSLSVEILGEEGLTGDLNVNVGKLFYENKFSVFSEDNDSRFRVGVMKLGYGILNEIDGLFAVLPSYYSYLYDLPRGLDTGLTLATHVFSDKLELSGSIYAGKNLRETDNKNRNIDTPPHHFRLTWTPNKNTVAGINYFSRKYEGQPLITGAGIDFSRSSLLRFWRVQVDLDLEAWTISSSLNGIENRGTAGMLAPKISLYKFFIQPYLAMETWSQAGTEDASEVYFTGKVGYDFHKHFQLVLEQTRIKNIDTDIDKENSLQARIVSNWYF